MFAPIGGFDAVTKSFETLAKKKGVQIQCGVTVTKVASDGVHVIDGAEGGKSFIDADLVLVNADLPYATETILLPSPQEGENGREMFDWNDKYDFSSGVIAFHWSIDKALTDLNTHNVFLAAENREMAEKSWRLIRSQESSGGDDDSFEPFNFYVHRASKVDPTAAPNNCDALLVLVPCKTLVRNFDYSKLPRDEAIQKYKEQFDEKVVSKAREAVLKRFEAIESLRGLSDHIIDEVVDTPGTYADQYNVAAGTPFALVRTTKLFRYCCVSRNPSFLLTDPIPTRAMVSANSV